MADPDKLNAALKRLIAGAASEEDKNTVRRAVLVGDITFSTEESSVAVGADIQNSVIVTGDVNQVQIELSNTAYEELRERVLPAPPGIAPPLPPFTFIGREDDLAHIKNILGVGTSSATKMNLAIVRGWPGVGKTTLVSVLARDPEVTKTFSDGVLWTSLGRHPNILSTLATWGRALGTDDLLRTPTASEATAQLKHLLHHKRMLLIVDDVWEPEHAAPFREICGNNCALLITTRLSHIAETVAPNPAGIYNLPVLSEADAIKLLSKLSPNTVLNHPKDSAELVRELEYLPLAIHIAGRLLNADEKLGLGVGSLLNEIREGASLISAQIPANRLESEVSEVIPTVAALFKQETDGLDEYTRGCFAYLGAFAPKPATFDLEAMSAIWMTDDPKPIVRNLVQRGLLEPVGPSRFQMHALLVMHARSLLTE